MSTFTELWTVRLGDWERGLIVSIFSSPFGILYDWAVGEGFKVNWRTLLKGAVAGGLAYIGKNFITGSKGNILSNK